MEQAKKVLETTHPEAAVVDITDRVKAEQELKAAKLSAERAKAAGIDAVVFGPGHIEQAHAADEYVELTQLQAAHRAFVRVLGTHGVDAGAALVR